MTLQHSTNMPTSRGPVEPIEVSLEELSGSQPCTDPKSIFAFYSTIPIIVQYCKAKVFGNIPIDSCQDATLLLAHRGKISIHPGQCCAMVYRTCSRSLHVA